MADEDFEIDVYGDTSADADSKVGDANTQSYDSNTSITIANGSNPPESVSNDNNINHHSSYDARDQHTSMENHDDHGGAPARQYQQGIKRKGESDDRPVDPGATNCLLLSDLNWWTTDDDIRGWVTQASCEDELKDITFSEHKVNGKSKGQAYLEFSSQQAATAAKHQIESAGAEGTQPGGKKHNVIYSSPVTNPFRTLPKDAPARGKDNPASRGGAGGNFNDRGGGNFRGRGNFNGPRGGFNRNFASGMNPGVGAAMNNGMMGGMGAMGMPMMGFQQPHFNPAFFGGNQQTDWQNPHGAKRPRGE
ncbi:hypothetical protein F5X97DRAFT_219297 [Nemania serpens]|nr:hypothetical protein F5X97DRAFT_219297 [Nemania serpens]